MTPVEDFFTAVGFLLLGLWGFRVEYRLWKLERPEKRTEAIGFKETK